MRRRLLLGLLGALAASACSDAASTAPISRDELAARLAAGEAPLVVDVRTPEEFATGRVPGARNLPHTELPDRLTELGPDRAREVVVYCERGGRAGEAEAALRAAGFTAVRHLEGDMSAWRREQRACEGC